MWEKISTFISEVRAEFTRVIWPTRDDLINSTKVVVVFSVIFSLFIGLFDLILTFVRGILIDL
jgi:preprotein translocase subunit SecE